MDDFKIIKSKVVSRVKNYKYFMIKDYVKNYFYVVDLAGANFLFQGYGADTLVKSDGLLCADNLDAMGISKDIEIFKDKKGFFIYYDTKKELGKDLTCCTGLAQRIDEIAQDKKKGVDPVWRDKTSKEIKEHRTVRLVGCYSTLKQAKQGVQDACTEWNTRGHFCSPQDKVIVMHTGTKPEKDFKGQYTWSPSALESSAVRE